jgi:hypothetical protein
MLLYRMPGSLRALIITGCTVCWVDMIRRPYLLRQIPILDRLPRKFLQAAQTVRQASKSSSKPATGQT